MAEVHQLVPPRRPFLASRQWAGPEGGNIVILPCIRRERLSELRPLTRDDRSLMRRVSVAQDEQSA